MNTSSLIKELCKEKNISMAELARRLGQTPQNFAKKLKRETVSTEELMAIGDLLGVKFEQSYTLENGEKISISNESRFLDRSFVSIRIGDVEVLALWQPT